MMSSKEGKNSLIDAIGSRILKVSINVFEMLSCQAIFVFGDARRVIRIVCIAFSLIWRCQHEKLMKMNSRSSSNLMFLSLMTLSSWRLKSQQMEDLSQHREQTQFSCSVARHRVAHLVVDRWALLSLVAMKQLIKVNSKLKIRLIRVVVHTSSLDPDKVVDSHILEISTTCTTTSHRCFSSVWRENTYFFNFVVSRHHHRQLVDCFK